MFPCLSCHACSTLWRTFLTAMFSEAERVATDKPNDSEPDPEPNDLNDAEPNHPELNDPESNNAEPNDAELNDVESNDDEAETVATDGDGDHSEVSAGDVDAVERADNPEPNDSQPDPEPNDPNDAEPNDPELNNAEPNDAEPNDPQPDDPQPNDPEPNDPELNDPELNNPEPNDPEPINLEPNDPERTNEFLSDDGLLGLQFLDDDDGRDDSVVGELFLYSSLGALFLINDDPEEDPVELEECEAIDDPEDFYFRPETADFEMHRGANHADLEEVIARLGVAKMIWMMTFSWNQTTELKRIQKKMIWTVLIWNWRKAAIRKTPRSKMTSPYQSHSILLGMTTILKTKALTCSTMTTLAWKPYLAWNPRLVWKRATNKSRIAMRVLKSKTMLSEVHPSSVLFDVLLDLRASLVLTTRRLGAFARHLFVGRLGWQVFRA